MALALHDSEKKGFFDRQHFNKDCISSYESRHEKNRNKNSIENDIEDNIMTRDNCHIEQSQKKHNLLRYNMEDIVQCIDSLYVKKSHRYHISFIGDSLIRNQFKNFILVSSGYTSIQNNYYVLD
jgi:hypothetical protein